MAQEQSPTMGRLGVETPGREKRLPYVNTIEVFGPGSFLMYIGVTKEKLQGKPCKQDFHWIAVAEKDECGIMGGGGVGRS